MHFRALVYYCLHVVHTALWSRMWSKLVLQKCKCGHLKIGQNIRQAVAAARRKAEEQNTVWSARKQPTEICGQQEPKPHGQIMWSEQRTAPFLPQRVLYCNSSSSGCQGRFEIKIRTQKLICSKQRKGDHSSYHRRWSRYIGTYVGNATIKDTKGLKRLKRI